MSEPEKINITLKVWRQEGPQERGRFETIPAEDVDPNMSFMEMLDALNENLILEDKEPIEFDNDCREGICGTCGAMVNGIPHGHGKAMTICQLHMRAFNDGDTIVVEPFRSRAFKVIKDLIVDRGALDKIIQAGGYISVNTGGTPDANAIPIAQETVEEAMDAAACIGCGACVATCPNAGNLPQCVGHAVCQCQGVPVCPVAPGQTGGQPACNGDASGNGCLRLRQLYQSPHV
jgi:succinate dehydrogenase / fumarate reductase iron-sulfur subunit